MKTRHTYNREDICIRCDMKRTTSKRGLKLYNGSTTRPNCIEKEPAPGKVKAFEATK